MQLLLQLLIFGALVRLSLPAADTPLHEYVKFIYLTDNSVKLLENRKGSFAYHVSVNHNLGLKGCY